MRRVRFLPLLSVILWVACIDTVDLRDPNATDLMDASEMSEPDTSVTPPDTGVVSQSDAEPEPDVGFVDSGQTEPDTGVEQPPVEDAGFAEDAHPMDATEPHPDADAPVSDCVAEGFECAEPIEAACPAPLVEAPFSCEVGDAGGGLICCRPA